jgi:hypothetical protein
VNEITKSFGVLRDEFHEGIKVLEEFASNIDAFVIWWNWMKMEENTQEERAQEIMAQKLRFSYDSLRLRSVIEKWENLKMQYVEYTHMV